MKNDKMKYKKLLASNIYLSDLTDEEIDKVLSFCQVKKLNKNGRLFAMGENGNKLYILVSGELHLWIKGGREIILKENDCFGEIALITDYGRLGTIRAIKESELIAIEKKAIIGGNVISDKSSLKVVQKMASISISYLLENFSLNARVLAQKGEGQYIEYKRSYPTEKAAKDKVFQTINAFLNSTGGTILLGVDDNGKVVGIKRWTNSLKDNLLKEIINRVNKFGGDILDYVSVNVEEVENKIVIRIDVQKIGRPVFMPNKAEDYYIRKNATNQKLSKLEVYKNILKRGIEIH